jgi:hypothetical protein
MQQQVEEERSQSYEEFPGQNERWYPDEELETLHVYLVAEKPKKPRRPGYTRDIILGWLTLCVVLASVVALCLLPSAPASTLITLRVPAHFTLTALQVHVAIIPTGKHTYAATQASGTLTIYNGAFLTQQLPAHFILITTDGIEVTTDQAVMIPSGNPPNYGITTVSAHAIIAGKQGNIQADAIDQTYGSAMSIKNLVPFTNGQDASTKPFVTSDDQAQALKTARRQLTAKQPLALLMKPCTETTSQHPLSLSVVWSCQYVTYRAPKNGQVLSVQVSGNSVILRMRIVTRPVVTHLVK